MIVTYTGHLVTALSYIAGFIVLALFWVWLILVFAEAIAQLWRELVIQCRLSVSAFRVSSPVRKRRPSRPKTPQSANPSSRPIDTPQRLSDAVTDTAEQQRQAPMAWATLGEPSIAERVPATAAFAASTDIESKDVPLFVVDAPLSQSDPDVLEARPANIFEALEDTCSAAKAAGYSDEEIARMLSSGQRPSRT